MILGAPGKISIMVDGQVVGMTAKPIHIVTENYTKAEAIAEVADIKRSFEITGNAIVAEPSQTLRDMWNDMMRGKMDVTIEQKVGKLPRKMKKAYRTGDRYQSDTKWKRKAKAYARRFKYRLPKDVSQIMILVNQIYTKRCRCCNVNKFAAFHIC